MVKKLIGKKLIDYVAMDVKAPLGAKVQSPKSKVQSYDKATGKKVNFKKIKESIEIMKNSGIEYEFRTTIVPQIHSKEDIIQIARDISPAKKYFLQNFRPEKTIDSKFEKIKPYPEEYMLEILKAIAPFFEVCQVR
jgi:pyruvate formate lyase activating enzyme